eukprot:3346060-Prymnesium_polylepis.1
MVAATTSVAVAVTVPDQCVHALRCRCSRPYRRLARTQRSRAVAETACKSVHSPGGFACLLEVNQLEPRPPSSKSGKVRENIQLHQDISNLHRFLKRALAALAASCAVDRQSRGPTSFPPASAAPSRPQKFFGYEVQTGVCCVSRILPDTQDGT